MSTRNLSQAEVNVLSKGLNFCPTPKEIDKHKLAQDLAEFSRKMKCRAYFENKSPSEIELQGLGGFKEKSTWCPNKVDPASEAFLKALQDKVLGINERGYNFSNLNVEEQEAFKRLKGYRDIVIKGADKGSAVVVWGFEDYCKEANRQLADTLIYERVSEEGNPLAEVSKVVQNRLENLRRKRIISDKNFSYLKGKNNKLGRFYLLPKIHKRLVDVPGRPVIANCGTLTEGLSELVDYYLQPVVKGLPNVIMDTTDFLRRLEDLGDIPEGAILCTMDVVGLYPHIPHLEGLSSDEYEKIY